MAEANIVTTPARDGRDGARPRLAVIDGGAERTLAELAAEANATHDAVAGLTRQALGAALACGAALIEIKERLEHGSFGAWLANGFNGSPRRAQEYMQVVRWAKARPPAHLESWSIDRALAAARHEVAKAKKARQSANAEDVADRIRRESDAIRARDGRPPLPPTTAEIARARAEDADPGPHPPRYADLVCIWADGRGGRERSADPAVIAEVLKGMA
jgi:Protein of unknown function (DUF3102)